MPIAKILRPLKDAVKETPVWPHLRPRRIHAYNLGAGRTGTTTIASIFSDSFRSVHEALVPESIRLLEAHWTDSLSDQEIKQEIRKRDRRHRFEFESSPFLGPFAEHLADVFPEAKFVLTVRSPQAWLRSTIDRSINNPRHNLDYPFVKYRNLAFGSHPNEYSPQERMLKRYGLYPLSAYLKYWSWHNRNVLRSVPPSRLLIVRTSDLDSCLPRLARFLNIKKEALSQPERKNKTSNKREVLENIDEGYLEGLIKMHCSETMQLIQRYSH
jgi:hypothetical protein